MRPQRFYHGLRISPMMTQDHRAQKVKTASSTLSRICRTMRRLRTKTKTTLNKNSKFVPSIVKDQGRLYSSLFYENASGTIVASYQGKVNKNVNLISTLHDYVAVDDSVKKNQNWWLTIIRLKPVSTHYIK